MKDKSPPKLYTLKNLKIRDIEKFKISPHGKWHVEDMTNLAFELGLIERDDIKAIQKYHGVVDLSVHTYAYAPAPILRVAGLWSTWLFYMDDQYDCDKETGTNIAYIQTLMENALEMVKSGNVPEDTSFWRYGQEFYRSFMALKPGAEVHSRLVAATAKYLFGGSIIQMKYWRDNYCPELNHFCHVRMWDSATIPCEIMVELCGNCVLPTSLFHDPRIEQLKTCWAKHIALLNDVYSYEKEVVEVGTSWNLIPVLQKNTKLTLPQAVDRAIRMVNSLAEDFEDIADELLKDPHQKSSVPLLSEYVYSMRQWMIGNIVFSNHTQRYSDPLHPEIKRPYSIPYLEE